MPHRTAVVPHTAVNAVSEGCDRDLFFVPIEGRHEPNHLRVFQSMLYNKLIVTHAGVGFSNLDNTVQHKLSVFALIQRKIIFF